MGYVMRLYDYYNTLRIKEIGINMNFRSDIKHLINLLQKILSKEMDLTLIIK